MKEPLFDKKRIPFPFVLEELAALRPTIKRVFGFTYVYFDNKLLCGLRDSAKQPGSNGMWIFTTTEEVESLGKEFPQLPKRYLWRSGKNAWVILPSRLEDFEEYAFRACQLMLECDRRIGRVTRGQAAPHTSPKAIGNEGCTVDDKEIYSSWDRRG